MDFFNTENKKFGIGLEKYILEGNLIYDIFYEIYNNFISITKTYIKNLISLLENKDKQFKTINYSSIFLVFLRQIIEFKINSLQKQISMLESYKEKEKYKNEKIENIIKELKKSEENLNKEINILNRIKENYYEYLKNMENYLIQYYIQNNNENKEPNNNEWKHKILNGKKILLNYYNQINKTEEIRKNYETIKNKYFNYINSLNKEKINKISNSLLSFLQSFIDENEINKIKNDKEKNKLEKIPLDNISFYVEMNQFYRYNEIKFIPYKMNIEKNANEQEFKDLIAKLKIKHNYLIASIINNFQKI
jgi:hypothetical protein